ncbi:MAG: hypothetical protein II262_01685 [Alistipes sp.]|nr:hypothetical protein [Alistipes sp.]
MNNNITEQGLDLIAGHLQSRIKGLSFPQEVSKLYFSIPYRYSMYDIQTLAERIAALMVMVGYTPVVQLDNLPDNVAGQINLNDSKYVYIKIDKSRFERGDYDPVELVAIVAHEMAHKFLWIHGFRDTSAKIEYMTDACAVYVGFGEYLQQAAERRSHETVDGKQMVVVHKLGYLLPWQIAYLRNRFFGLNLPYAMFKNQPTVVDKTEQEKGVSWNTVALIVCVVLLLLYLLVFA